MTHKWLRFPKAYTKEQWLKLREPFHWEVRRGHTPEDSVFVSRCKNYEEAIQTAIRDCEVQDRMNMGFSLSTGLYQSYIRDAWEMVVPAFGRKYWLRAWGFTGGLIHARKERR